MTTSLPCQAPLATPPAPQVPFTPSARYPDPAIEVLDERFLKIRLYSSGVEQLTSGLRWAEGPVWWGDGRFLLLSDVAGNSIWRWDACSGHSSVFRSPSQHANGLARDRSGRLVTCEHLSRRVTRTEIDGRITVLAEQFDGRRLNSPNDIVCAPDGSLWFTDPSFGIDSHWEGGRAPQELPHAVYRLAPDGQTLQQCLSDLAAPNGLAFAPGGRVLYIVESRAAPWRKLWAYDVAADGALSGRRLVYEARDGGALDGITVDEAGNLWCGYGSNGHSGQASAELDGVRVIDAEGRALAHIHLPERCANLCFGGEKSNRVFMAASHSLYALYVNVCGTG